MSSSFIRRIITMRDSADGRRKKPAISSKKYALACPSTLYDDSDSDDADDEYETGDEFQIISSSDNNQSEQDEVDDIEDSWYYVASDDASNSLEIIEDYLNSPTLIMHQEFHGDLLESSESKQNDVPVITLNITNSAEMDVNGNAKSTISMEKAGEEDGGNDYDSWPLASACCDDSWTTETETEEEECVTKEDEQFALPKVRRNPTPRGSSSSQVQYHHSSPGPKGCFHPETRFI
ncbi:hypothetical protein PG990_006118 [Apiospora arundinis]|uniref:Uncharacterized protein n=1 Tax=Apiospora arundinis TaxID=335852 RepID=A0ABR2J999_9PEZI